MRGRIEPVRIVWLALALAMLAAAVLIFHYTRGTTLWFDEWNWALHRRGGGLDSLLDPYNGHFSLVPVAIYLGISALVFAWLIFFGFKHLPFRTRSTNAKIKNAQAFKPARYPSLLLKTEPNNFVQTYSHTLLKTRRHDFIPLSILTAERIMPA